MTWVKFDRDVYHNLIRRTTDSMLNAKERVRQLTRILDKQDIRMQQLQENEIQLESNEKENQRKSALFISENKKLRVQHQQKAQRLEDIKQEIQEQTEVHIQNRKQAEDEKTFLINSIEQQKALLRGLKEKQKQITGLKVIQLITVRTLESKFDKFYDNFNTGDVDKIIENYKIMTIRTNSLENQIKDMSDSILKQT